MIGKGTDCLFPLYIPIDGYHEKLRVRCGTCVNCKMHRSQEWCMRLEMESNYWKDICFVTLTYNDESLPRHVIDGHLFFSDEEIEVNPDLEYVFIPTLSSDHLKLYIKRLRKHLDHRIRYFAVGEYGTKRGRPHLHIMFFGLNAVDVNTRRLLREQWHYGFVDVRPFFKETCTYIAGYVQKKLYGKDRDFFRFPEFMRCSQHLGEQWLMDHLDQFDDDHPWIMFHGFKYGIPRAFRKILVRLGIIKESSQIALALKQFGEYVELEKDLRAKGTNLSEFFHCRWKNALAKAKRKSSKRDATGDI